GAAVKQALPPYRLRAASEADAPFLAATSAHGARRYLITAPRDAAAWRYVIGGRSAGSAMGDQGRIIERQTGDAAGYVEHVGRLLGPRFAVRGVEGRPGGAWGAVAHPVLAYLCETAETYARETKTELGFIDGWMLGSAHPFAGVVQFSATRRPYAYYLRVPDLPDLLRRLTPVLERRLADSPFVGHSGELRLSFYRSGLRLVLAGGRGKSGEGWTPSRPATRLDFGLPSSDERGPSPPFPGLQLPP